MSSLKQILDEEIRRVARKEIKQILTPVLAKMSEMQKTISAQEKMIRETQKHCSLPTVSEKVQTSESTDVDAAAAKVPRITKARIVKLRNKLGLSQMKFAHLLGASLPTINHWESGKTVPRLEQKIRLAEIRDMGKRELEKLFREKNIAVQANNASTDTATESPATFDKECLTTFREAHGFSKTQLALLLGVSQFSVGRWESGKGEPREAQKIKITELLALSEEQLQQKLVVLSEKKRETGNVPQKTEGESKKA